MRLSVRMVIAGIAIATAGAQAQFDCPPGFIPLEDAISVAGNGSVCYQFQIPEGSPFVRFEVDAAGAPLDLYFTEGVQQSLSDWDRVNVGPIEGDAKFVLLEPSPGDYTVAVHPGEASANYSLQATAALVAGGEPLTVCTDDGLCSTALPMTLGPQAIQLGADFGDRVIFPLTLTAPGTIRVTAHWQGSAQRLALILNGPKRPELGNPVAYYSRSDGTSPLELSYTVTAEDLVRGRRFQVSLVNFSGGEATGGIDIQTTRSVVFNYARLTNLTVNPGVLQPVDPGAPKPAGPGTLQPVGPVVAEPVKPVIVQPPKPQVVQPQIQVQPHLLKTQEQVCQEGVQGKIAWDYQGNKSWGKANLERLCKGTQKGSEPARCFRQIMHGGVDWGGGTRWEWRNAVDLCEGTSDASHTVRCFQARIRRGAKWQSAIKSCETR